MRASLLNIMVYITIIVHLRENQSCFSDYSLRSGPTRKLPRQSRIPNAERRTPNAERRTPNAERRTPNAKRQTPNAKRQTPNAKRQTPNAKRQTPNFYGSQEPKLLAQNSHSLDPFNFETRSESFDQQIQLRYSVAALFGQSRDFELPNISLPRSIAFGRVFGHPFDNEHDFVQSGVFLAQRLSLIVAFLEFAENLVIGEIRRVPVLGQESLTDKMTDLSTHCASYESGFTKIQKKFAQKNRSGFEQK